MTTTYFEAAQKALLRAAREVREVACSVLDDMQNDVELASENSHEWARDKAAFYARLANDLEAKADEVGPHFVSAARTRSHRRYSSAITAYEIRRADAKMRSLAQMTPEAVEAVERGVWSET